MFMFGRSKDSISTDELQQKLEKGEKLTIIDVRETYEFAMGHIPGAKNVPLGGIYNYKPKGKDTVYVICQSGARSQGAYKTLKQEGIDVVNVAGGMSRWRGRTIR